MQVTTPMGGNSVLDYLDETARRFPDKIAFVDEQRSITYGALRAQAMALGTFIAASQPACAPVLVTTAKSVQDIICFFGVLYSGSFYCPVDTSLPDLRIQRILETLQPKMIFVHGQEEDRLVSILAASGVDAPVYAYADGLFAHTDTALLAAIRSQILKTNPVYIMFTSGSTGTPKGIRISNGALISFIECFVDTFGVTDTDVIGNQAPFDFDVSVKDIYSAVKTGATVCIIPRAAFMFPEQLIGFLQTHRPTVLIWAVSALSLVASSNAFLCGVPDTVKTIMFSGEVMPIKYLNYWRNALPKSLYVNLYGPTEITCNCLYYIVDRDFGDTETLPLGKAFAHTAVLVLNEEGQIAAPDETGELCVRGPNLADDYYNNPEQTARAFVQNPLNKRYPERIYRTGDLAKQNDRGEWVFAARKDFQIKHLGHRIELNEVEIAVNALAHIRAAVCLYDTAREKIVLVYEGAAADPKYIVEGLKPVLPKYMFPQRFIAVDKMPYTKNLKVDRVKLRDEYLK